MTRFSCMLLLGAFHCAAAHAASPPSAQVFFQDALVSNATLSPNGRTLAMVVAGKGERAGLVVVDLASMTQRVLVRYAEGDVNQISWLNDKRLMYSQLNLPKTISESRSGMYAINLDGTRSKGLLPRMATQRSFAADSFNVALPLRSSGSFGGMTATTSNSLFILAWRGEDTFALTKLNTLTGDTTVHPSPFGSFRWIFGDKPEVRLTVSRKGDKEQVQFQDNARTWRTLGTFLPSDKSAFSPLVYADNILYVHGNKGADRSSLYQFDVDKLELAEQPLVSSPMFDIDGIAVTDGTHLLGYRYHAGAEKTAWFDAAMKVIQQEVDALLPATVNRLTRADRPETPYILVVSYSPRHPPETLVYNQASKKLTSLGKQLDGIAASDMAETEMQQYKARDGMDIPVFVTLPNVALKKTLPTIILAGSSPWSRDVHGVWDPAVQFLASRGYAVIQPNARGSSGYGKAFAKAGIKQWGLGMQDDLADGARWAIAQGIADPKRICIAGNGYGGYAALMGMVKDPELFRCAVSWAGIVDIDLMFQNKWEDFPGSDAFIKTMVGDPATDQAQFSTTSPLKNAAKIKGPVFLAYGAEDAAVPGKHGRLLYEALKPGNPMAEFHLYDEKGQDASLAGNRADMWGKMAAFLDKHLSSAK